MVMFGQIEGKRKAFVITCHNMVASPHDNSCENHILSRGFCRQIVNLSPPAQTDMYRVFLLLFSALVLFSGTASAQDRIASPRGEAATQVGGSYVDGSYTGGSWITVDYGRPILRGRTEIWGTGADYGKALLADSQVWRLGANKSTRLWTERDLIIGGKRLPAGEYSLFVDIREDAWTLVISNHKAQAVSGAGEEGLWGSYGYEKEMDALRTEMDLVKNHSSMDQLTISFIDMTQEGGTLTIMWDYVVASVPFSLAP